MTANDLSPVSKDYSENRIILETGSRLHGFVARLMDTHVDDVTSSDLMELERKVDAMRVTHADGKSFT